MNTKPLLHGIKEHEIINQIILIEDYPARIADMLLNNEIDIGLVPVAIIPRLKEYHIVGEFCIGSEGDVASVCIFSPVPMQEIKTIILDNQSRTSVALAKILLRDYWKQPVDFIQATAEDYREKITGTTAALIIGDRALEQRNRTEFIFDLGGAWKNHTGLPFVYAAWIANKVIPPEFIKGFNEANAWGLNKLAEVIEENKKQSPSFDLARYYTEHISYHLTTSKRKGLELFLSKL